MNENVIIIPGNEAELIELYLDKKRHKILLERYNVLKRAQEIPLESGFPESNSQTTSEIRNRYMEVSRQIFSAAIKGLAERFCEEQRSICSHKFMIAPIGREESWIERAPMPCLYEKGQYEILQSFRKSLNTEEIKGLMEKFPDVFDESDARESLEDFAARREESPSDDDTIIGFCSERWDELSVDEKLRIYRNHSSLSV